MPLAFGEHPDIRNAYIRVFIAHAFHGASHAMVRFLLDSFASTFRSNKTKGVKTMATTLTTLERRLGLDTSEYIKYYFLSDRCWFRHEPEMLYALTSPDCTQPDCPGKLYTIRNTSEVPPKRVPTKILPYAPIESALQHILLRPGKWDDFQHWRQAGDLDLRSGLSVDFPCEINMVTSGQRILPRRGRCIGRWGGRGR